MKKQSFFTETYKLMEKNEYYFIQVNIKDDVKRSDLPRNAEKLYLRSLLIANVAHDNPHIPTHLAQIEGLEASLKYQLECRF